MERRKIHLRKPFFTVRHSVKKGKVKLFTASENNALLGFVMVIPYKNFVMVDYLAVSNKVRSKGTGSLLMQEMCRRFKDRKIALLIEQLDEIAENSAQRIARRNFYLKNGFASSNIFIEGTSGKMEIMTNYTTRVFSSSRIRTRKTILPFVKNKDSGVVPAIF